MLIHSQDWVSVDSNLSYLTPVISSGERNYMKESCFDCLVDVSYIIVYEFEIHLSFLTFPNTES